MPEIINYNKDDYNFPSLVVLGCFDAIHAGHAELLKKAKLQAKINGLDLGVMMFAEGKGGRQVYSFEERLSFLAAYNVKFVLKIDYTDEFKKTTAADFLHNLEEHINVKAYMSGKDFRFGAGAKGKSSTLKNYADDEENGVWYMSVKDVAIDGEKVSTTLIKQCLEAGEIQKANKLLGREYFVSGEVCEGHGRGTGLGFPTANIVYPANKIVVAPGVYGVEAEIDGQAYKGVANCGPRPTFGEDATVLEAYFEGLDKEIYGQNITIKFINFIRKIRKFESAEALSAQIAEDVTKIGSPDNLSEEPATEEVAPAEEVAVAAEEVKEELGKAPAEGDMVEVVEDEVETPAEELAVAAEAITEDKETAPAEETLPAEEVAPEEECTDNAEETADDVEVAAEEVKEELEKAPAEGEMLEVVEDEVETPAEELAVAAEAITEDKEEAAHAEENVPAEVAAPTEECTDKAEEPATVEEPALADAVSDPEGEESVAAAPAEDIVVEKLVAEVFEESAEPQDEEDSAEEDAQTESVGEGEAENAQPSEKKSKKRKRSRGKADRRRGDTRKR